jgi:hypothetical protein
LTCVADLVRNQRNKFVTLIGAARQAAAEMNDRLKLVSSELGVLQQEAAGKGKVLGQVSLTSCRDRLRTECVQLMKHDDYVISLDHLGCCLHLLLTRVLRLCSLRGNACLGTVSSSVLKCPVVFLEVQGKPCVR